MPNVESAAICVLMNRADARRRTGERPAKKASGSSPISARLETRPSMPFPRDSNHNHTCRLIWACQRQGRLRGEAVLALHASERTLWPRAGYNRRVQHGTNPLQHRPRAFSTSGRTHRRRVYGARIVLQVAATPSPQPAEPVPAGVHLRPVARRPPEQRFTQNRFHYNWHWFWDSARRTWATQGIHQVEWPLGSRREVTHHDHLDLAGTSCSMTIRYAEYLKPPRSIRAAVRRR